MGSSGRGKGIALHRKVEKEIEIDGLRLAYEESGNPKGMPVVLLHGWGCDHTTVRSIASCLDDGMRIISLDLPGHGKSGEPEDVWGTEDFADLVLKLIDRLKLENASLIGHSFGGRTSIAASAKAGEGKIWKIVLVDSAGVKPKRSLQYYYKVYSYKALKKLALSLLGKEKGQKMIERKLRKSGSADYQAATPKMRAIMSKCVNEDLKKEMPKITAPTLLIWGEEDKATPIEDAKKMEKLIPDCGLVSFGGCGHYSFLDNPAGFKAVLREFFKYELNR